MMTDTYRQYDADLSRKHQCRSSGLANDYRVVLRFRQGQIHTTLRFRHLDHKRWIEIGSRIVSSYEVNDSTMIFGIGGSRTPEIEATLLKTTIDVHTHPFNLGAILP